MLSAICLYSWGMELGIYDFLFKRDFKNRTGCVLPFLSNFKFHGFYLIRRVHVNMDDEMHL